MNPFNFDHSKARVQNCTYSLVMPQDTNDADGLGIPRYESLADTPTIYEVNVQVRCRFICFSTWQTIWTASCDISDDDTRAYIENRANEVCNLINAEL